MSRRSKSLHAPMASDLGGRFLAASFVLMVLMLSVLYTLMWFRGIALGLWNFLDLIVLLVLYPLALWTVAGISVLVRLLSYLDTRIRLEGWEVELAIRAEAMRQFGEEAGLIVTQDHPPLRPQGDGHPVEPRTDLGRDRNHRCRRRRTHDSLWDRSRPLGDRLSMASGSRCPVSFAQTPPRARSPVDGSLSDSVWYDADRDEVIPVTVKPIVDDSLNRDSRWLPKAKRIKQPPKTSTTSAGGGTGTHERAVRFRIDHRKCVRMDVADRDHCRRGGQQSPTHSPGPRSTSASIRDPSPRTARARLTSRRSNG